MDTSSFVFLLSLPSPSLSIPVLFVHEQAVYALPQGRISVIEAIRLCAAINDGKAARQATSAIPETILSDENAKKKERAPNQRWDDARMVTKINRHIRGLLQSYILLVRSAIPKNSRWLAFYS